MTKLKLKLEDLAVSSFVVEAEEEQLGTVNGYVIETQLRCTGAEGCYPSLYCSGTGTGAMEATCFVGCMTNANGQC